MAKVKRDDFDAEGFIEAMRVSAVPTYHTAEKKESTTAPPEVPPDAKEEAKEASPNVKSSTFELPKTNPEEKYASMGLTPDEITFVKQFIVTNNYRRVVQGKQIFIRKEFHKLIGCLIKMTDEDCSLSSYIDNVLFEHFSKHYLIMQAISDKIQALH